MHALGNHLLIELRECKAKNLNDVKEIETIMVTAAKLANATVKETVFHEFIPHGVSGMVIIAESHLSIHTWPEYEYAAVDIFTCGDTLDPEKAVEYLVEKFQSENSSVTEVKRGILSPAGKKLPHKAEVGTEKKFPDT